MLKTLSAYIGEYKKDSIKTPIYIIVEVLMEILIPFVTASIIDKGIQAGDMSKVFMYGGLMLVLAFISLFPEFRQENMRLLRRPDSHVT